VSKSTPRYHLHIENGRKRLPILQITAPILAAALKRHPLLAKQLRVTVGWDGDIIDDALQTADFLIHWNPPRENLRERAPRLRWIQTTGAGIDVLMPLNWLPRDIALTNNTGAHGDKAEDSCLLAMLMLHQRMPEMIQSQHASQWAPVFTTPIAGRTVVVIGFGDLGRAAGRAAKKLDLNVIAVTRSGKAARPADTVVKVSAINRVLPKADFLIVATPLTAETSGLINRTRLNLLKREAFVINIGRSPIVDYEALREKLEAGELAGALLDVHSPEPLPASSPLWKTRNLIITPHTSCDDPRYMHFLCDTWFANFARLLENKPLKNRVDRTLGY
jgi:phosphoglycerate dehydrogenase-like enzyme